ncbi:MAG TPA: orotate phosphoribosyltransferase [Chitinophagales bacterium]|nr:orotate phosphoribosyltransferase [Chitinophagales bacterium]
MISSSNQLAEYLLQIKAIQLNVQSPFTWASGWKSPVYCDNRIILSYPEVRDYVKEHMVEMVRKNFPDANCIAGVATAGIPHAAMIADALGLPMVYVRDKPKGHGMQNTIEGRLPEYAKVVVVEDVISTGKSSLKAVEDLKRAGASIEGMAAIYTYEFTIAKNRFSELEIPLFTITNYSDLIAAAVRVGDVNSEYIPTLNEWREHPEIWKQ